MTILDKVKVGNTVKVNLELSKDRLSKEVINALNISTLGKISEFKITDGKGIGVILKLSNGKEQWFFENEIEILDQNGNVIERHININENNNFIVNISKNLKYENKNKISDLLNPLNFLIWLIISFKDVI
tara:strand:+ start:29 stop:418 length:390 start_codon:yes stop_codon:yes gene_type:complete